MNMERHLDSEVDRETPTDAGRCQTCHIKAVAMAIIILVTGLSLSSVLLIVLRAAADVDQASKPSVEQLTERLQQCLKEQRDVNLMLHTATRESRCSLCPASWRWWSGHCYFFSVGLQDRRRWGESAEFCQLHNSTLAVIKDSAEMEFIQGVMQEFPRFPFLWVGLTDSQQEGQWLWLDGMDVQHYSPGAVQWDSDSRDCADLRGGGRLFAADCEESGPWVCKKES
ncbi:hypothetical protein Q5P01_002658 [Channa striata]|uniref:C-type lectin domain-containing protein n=1 Tax=Channa striata TaxID=64152 RepID=A0AA88NPL3_CHASR|nr:hypothetical protein Q5P01_002658 [Channa striata]